jgi:hypothetical protein
MKSASRIKGSDTEYRRYPAIEYTTQFDSDGNGPAIRPLDLVAALTPSPHYPDSRITLCCIGSTSVTVQQATKLRDQLTQAIADVAASCPSLDRCDGASAPPSERWCYSRNEEGGWVISDAYVSKADAVTAAMGELEIEPGDTFYTARALPLTPEWIGAEAALQLDVADTIDDRVLAEVGCDDGIDVTKGMLDDLRGGMATLIAVWLGKYNLTPKWNRLEEVERHTYAGEAVEEVVA